jgi:hypothetical protein
MQRHFRKYPGIPDRYGTMSAVVTRNLRADEA